MTIAARLLELAERVTGRDAAELSSARAEVARLEESSRLEPLCKCHQCGEVLAVKFRDSKPDPSWWVTPCPKCKANWEGDAEAKGIRRVARELAQSPMDVSDVATLEGWAKDCDGTAEEEPEPKEPT